MLNEEVEGNTLPVAVMITPLLNKHVNIPVSEIFNADIDAPADPVGPAGPAGPADPVGPVKVLAAAVVLFNDVAAFATTVVDVVPTVVVVVPYDTAPLPGVI